MATPEMRRDTCTLHHKAVLKLKEDAPPPGTSADHGLQQSLEAALNLPSVITAALLTSHTWHPFLLWPNLAQNHKERRFQHNFPVCVQFIQSHYPCLLYINSYFVAFPILTFPKSSKAVLLKLECV